MSSSSTAGNSSSSSKSGNGHNGGRTVPRPTSLLGAATKIDRPDSLRLQATVNAASSHVASSAADPKASILDTSGSSASSVDFIRAFIQHATSPAFDSVTSKLVNNNGSTTGALATGGTPLKIGGDDASSSEAQRQYAQGFLDALSHIHRINNFVPQLPSPGLLPQIIAALTPTTETPVIANTRENSNNMNGTSNKATQGSSSSLSSSSTSSTSSSSSSSATSSSSSSAAANAGNGSSLQSLFQAMQSLLTPTGPQPSAAAVFGSRAPATSTSTTSSSNTSSSKPPRMASPSTVVASSSCPSSASSSSSSSSSSSIGPLDLRGGIAGSTVSTGTAAAVAATNLMPPPALPSTNLLEIRPRALAFEPPPSSSMQATAAISSYNSAAVPPPPPAPAGSSTVESGARSNRSSRSTSVASDDSSVATGSGGMMTTDDAHKLERKRQRNRVAASRCRQKKLERIEQLQNEVTEEKTRAHQLDAEIDALQRQYNSLQRILQQHQNRGCPTHQHPYKMES